MLKVFFTVCLLCLLFLHADAYGGKYAIHDEELDVFTNNEKSFSVTVKRISQNKNSFQIEHEDNYLTFVRAGKPICVKTSSKDGRTEKIDFQDCLAIFNNTESAICDAQFTKKDKTLGSICLTHTHSIDNIKTTLILPLKMDLSY